MSNNHDYTIAVSNTFEAESPEDAIMQMIAYLADHAHVAGYRYDNEDTGETGFIDAETIALGEGPS